MVETWQAIQALHDIEESNFGEKKCPESALRVAAEVLKMQIPEQVTVKDWSPSYCPSCGHKLSVHQGDGYYRHPTFWRDARNVVGKLNGD